MSSRSKPAIKRKKGFSRLEKVAGLVILFVAIWAVYSVIQPPPQNGSTTSATSTGSSGVLDFTLPEVGPNGLTGQKISLSQFRGKIVFLEFMEPWCGHCQNMMPTLESLYKQFEPQNVVFLAVAGSWAGPNGVPATADDAAAFIRNYKSSMTYVYDSSGSVFTMFGVNSTPTIFLIAKNGQILSTHQGEVAFDVLAAEITRFKT